MAARAPLAATAGTPMPGLVLSPQRSRPGNGVVCPGKVPFPADIAGPYVPWYRRLKRACVRGDPISRINVRARTSGISRSIACLHTSKTYVQNYEMVTLKHGQSHGTVLLLLVLMYSLTTNKSHVLL